VRSPLGDGVDRKGKGARHEIAAGLIAAVAGGGIVGAMVIVDIIGPPRPRIFDWEQVSALVLSTLLLGGGLADILYRAGRRPHAEMVTRPLFLSVVAASGALLVAAAMLLDHIGLAGYSGFGWKQATAAGIGTAALGAAGRLGWQKLLLKRGTRPGVPAPATDSAAVEPVGTSMQPTPGSGFRYPELDGLRGIAILMVVEIHYEVLGIPLSWLGLSELQPLLTLGWSGVDLFFVLSGFLLGGILLDNKGSPNYFKVFYLRRVCRIFPLYFLVVGLLLLAPPPGGGLENSVAGEPLPAWSYLTFTQNFAMAAEGPGSVWLTPTWSLAVEEQFYLVLPLLIALVSRGRLPYVLVGLTLTGLLARFAILAFQSEAGSILGLVLPTRADPLLLGILGAWVIRQESLIAVLRVRMRVMYAILLALVVSAALLVLVGPYGKSLTRLFPLSYGYLLLGLTYGCAVLIAVTERTGLMSAVTRNRPLRKVGSIAYGVYMIQLPVKGLIDWLVNGNKPLERLDPGSYIASLGALAVTLGLASISWIFFEKRIVNWGRSFRYKPARSASTVPPD
jgi:peptidoglycan/LPS O-acetylase OafA/YrhL